MFRFVLLTFVFLGWAFYEMSGGASFNPEDVRQARLEAAAQAEAEAQAKKEAKVLAEEALRKEVAEEITIAQAPKVFVDTDPPLDPQGGVSLASLSGDDAAQTDDKLDLENASLSQEGTRTTVILPSLIASDDTSAGAVQPLATVSEDIRTVSGNRVNVRGGPGTEYGVVSRLVRGDAVKVLEDDGNGWVRFEPVNGGPGGWMADFLLIGG